MRARTALLGAGVVGLFLAHALYLSGVAEDAFISFRFARNLVDGYGLVWNPGEPPVEGYTNFLWMLVAALWIGAGVDPVWGAQATGLAAGLGTLFVTWRAGTLLGFGPREALLPCFFLALSGPFAAWATGGLETTAFGFLLTLGAVSFARAWQVPRERRHLVVAYLVLLAAALTRPEGVLALGALGALGWVLAGAGRRRAVAVSLLPAVLLFAGFIAWRWSTFGHPLPNTFYAKTGNTPAQVARGASYLGFFALHYLVVWVPLLALAWRARGDGGREPTGGLGLRLRRQPLLATCALLVAVFAAAIVWEGGDYMALYRFVSPLLPLLYLLLVAAARGALRGEPGQAASLAGRAALACAALGTLFHSTPLEASLLPKPPGMHGNWRGVQNERWHVARLSEIGRFFARHANPDESLATDAIGAVSWYSGLRVYGGHGLVDPVLARRASSRVGAGFPGHERLDFAYLLGKRPTFLMYRRDLMPERPRGLKLNVPLPEELAREYELRSAWLEDPVNGEAGWFPFLERRDRSGAPELERRDRSAAPELERRDRSGAPELERRVRSAAPELEGRDRSAAPEAGGTR